MENTTILLAILIPSLGLFTIAILYIYFLFNQRAEIINKENITVPAVLTHTESGTKSSNSDPSSSLEHSSPTKLSPLNLDIVLTLGTVYLLVATVLALGLTGKINDATMGALLAGMVGFVLGNRLGKSI